MIYIIYPADLGDVAWTETNLITFWTKLNHVDANMFL